MPLILGTSSADKLVGASDVADTLYGGGAGDRIEDVSGSNVIYADLYFHAPQDRGDGGNDTISAGKGFNLIYAGGGDDVVLASDHSTIYGGSGNDEVISSWYSLVEAGDGDDVVNAAGPCTVDGGAGDDRLGLDGPLYGDEALTIGGQGRDWIHAVSTVYTDDLDPATPAEGGDLVVVFGDILDRSVDFTCVVQDFKPGAGGDVLQLTRLLGVLTDRGYDGINPLLERSRLEFDGARVVQSGDGMLGGDSWMRLLEVDGGVQVQFEPYRGAGYITVAWLRGVGLAQLAPANFDPPFSFDGAADDGPWRHVSDGADWVLLSDGDDTVAAGDGDDEVYTTSGNDHIDGGTGGDRLHGGTGNDRIDGGTGDDQLYGGEGDDALLGGLGDDRLFGDSGADTLLGGQGADVLLGDGNDTLRGEDDSDRLWLADIPGDPSRRAALLDGGAGADWLAIYSNAGRSTLLGGAGDDSISIGANGGNWGTGPLGASIDGGEGNDSITAQAADAATVLGGAGDDTIVAQGGGILVEGGAGDDRIQLQASYLQNSRVVTGTGADVVVLDGHVQHPLWRAAVVTDFQPGAGGDRLDLGPLYDSSFLPPGQDPFAAGVLRLTAGAGGTCIELDANNPVDGVQFQTLLALQGVKPQALTAANFVQAVQPVFGGNVLPRAQIDKTIVLAEDATPVALKLNAPVDPDGGKPTLSIISTTLLQGRLLLDGQVLDAFWDPVTLTPAQLARLKFKPDADANGPLGGFSYMVTDDEGSAVVCRVNLEATPRDDAPRLRLPSDLTRADTVSDHLELDLDFNVQDPDGSGELQFSFTTNGRAGLPGWLQFDAYTHILSGSLPYRGPARTTLGVTVTDATGLQSTDSFVLHRAGDGRSIWNADGRDVLLGGSAGDLLYGWSGDDRLNGRAGNDSLSGWEGNDTLIAGNGQDWLVGGSGQDSFRFTGTGTATLADFEPAQDRLEFSHAVFQALGRVGHVKVGAFVEGRAAQDADDRLLYDRASGELFYDADGTGAVAAVLLAKLTPGTALAAGDLFVV